MKKKRPLKAIKRDLDKYFSLFIRARDAKKTGGMCFFCGTRPIECCFHIVTRSKFSVRWDPENAVASCSPCNYFNEFNPDPYRVAYIKKFGLKQYEGLVARSNVLRKWDRAELEEMLEKYRTHDES